MRPACPSKGRRPALLTRAPRASLLDEDGASLAPIAPNSAAASTSSLGSTSSTVPSKARERLGIDDDAHFAPYADDPERGPEPEPATMVQMQRQTMEGALCNGARCFRFADGLPRA